MSKDYLAPLISTVRRDVDNSGSPSPSIAAGPEKAGLGELTPLAGVGVESEEAPTPTIPEQPGTRRSTQHSVQRQLPNVHKLGELHHIDIPNLELFLTAQAEDDQIGYIHYTEDVEMVEPTTHAEALASPQRANWREARAR